MSEMDDHDLLARYARENSEAAFAALVTRHVNLVYSVAWRSVGNAHAAEEITQAVFIILAQKAGRISPKTILPGWLYQTVRLTAANFLRGEIRRQKREQEAYMQSTLNQPDTEAWSQIAPLLDDALDRLGERDRNAIVLRFFENKSLREVGVVMGAGEDATKMRVNRALEKLRKIFTKRGLTLSAMAIAGAVAANSVQAAPAGLAKTISAVAVAKGAAAATSTLTLVKGALNIMTWTKTKTATAIGVVAILAVTSTTVTGFKLMQKHRPIVKPAAGLYPTMINATGNIQPDGTVLFQGTVEEANSTSHTISADTINEVGKISQISDESGNPMKFTRLSDGSYFIALSKPVPPGGKVSYTLEGTLAGLVKSNGADEYEIGFTHNAGNIADMHLVQVWRLPVGATLLEKNRGIQETTNDSRIELRIDKILPPNSGFPIGFRYRLAANAQ